jgi:hypothetical protein
MSSVSSVYLVLILQCQAAEPASWRFWEKAVNNIPLQPQQYQRWQPAEAEQSRRSRESFKSTHVIGDWVAQWDQEYQQWFYYNQVSDESTWDQPRELQQFQFDPPVVAGPTYDYLDYFSENYVDIDGRQPVIRQAIPGSSEFPVVNPNNIFCGLLDPRPECQTTAAPATTTIPTTTVSTTTVATTTSTTTTTTTTSLDAIQLLKRDKPLGPGGRYNGLYDAIYGVYSKFFELLYVDLRVEW